MNQSDEFQGREAGIANELTQLLMAFNESEVKSEYSNRVHYANYIQLICAMKNLQWAVKLGIINMEQALALTMSVPVASVVDLSYYGKDESKFDASFAVNARRRDTSKLQVDAGVKQNIEAGTGGVASFFGASVKSQTEITASTTFGKESQRDSNYECKVHVQTSMKRFPPPEGVAILLDATNTEVKGSVEINKIMVENQKAVLRQQAEGADTETKDWDKGSSDSSDFWSESNTESGSGAGSSESSGVGEGSEAA